MRPSKFSDRQITNALDGVRAGTSVVQMCRTLGITHTTFYRWRKQHGGVRPDGVTTELQELREENKKLRTIVSNFLLDKLPFKIDAPVY